jgi:hypothetical protein
MVGSCFSQDSDQLFCKVSFSDNFSLSDRPSNYFTGNLTKLEHSQAEAAYSHAISIIRLIFLS